VKKLGIKAFETSDKNQAGLWHQVGPESEHFDWEKFEKKIQVKPESSKTNTYYAIFDPRMPDLNYDCERVHDEICRIGRIWLELGVDGFRLDAAKYFYKPSHLKSNLSWWKKFRQEMSRINPSIYLIGEVWDLSIRIAPYLRSLDSLFNFEFAQMIISCILNEGNGSSILNSYTRIINYYSKESDRQDILDAIFLSNHDQDRIMSILNNNLSKAKIAAALLLTLPGLPFIYYGEEIGMLGTTPHDKYRREPFLWSSTNKQGQTTWLEPKYTKISNGCIPLDEQLNDPNSLVNHYKKFIQFRRQSDILLFGLLKPISTRIRSLCLFERVYHNKSLFIAHNIGSRRQQIIIPKDYNEVILSTQNENSIPMNRQWNLEAYSSVIFQSNK
jgi:glycosidase